MFSIIDAAAGLTFVYMLLSVVCSALREYGETLAGERSKFLRRGLNRLLGGEIAQRLYEHPVVGALAERAGGPVYIPARTFSAALRDLLGTDVRSGGVPDRLREALRSLEASAGGDAVRLQAEIESWFNSAMDAVSRGYKRHTRVLLAAVGLAVTIAMNADSIRMVAALLGDPVVRGATVNAAGQFAEARSVGGAQAAEELKTPGLPIGWSGATLDNTLPWKTPWTGPCWRNAWLLVQWHWVGWLITAAAISLGAPFWFDLLNRLAGARAGPGAGPSYFTGVP